MLSQFSHIRPTTSIHLSPCAANVQPIFSRCLFRFGNAFPKCKKFLHEFETEQPQPQMEAQDKFD
jgi:hypothetical protein